MIIYNLLYENPDSTNIKSWSSLEKAYMSFIFKIEHRGIRSVFEPIPKIEDIKKHFDGDYYSHKGYFCLGKNIKYGFYYHLFQVEVDDVKHSPGFSMYEKHHQEKSESEIFNVNQFLLEQGFTMAKNES